MLIGKLLYYVKYLNFFKLRKRFLDFHGVAYFQFILRQVFYLRQVFFRCCYLTCSVTSEDKSRRRDFCQPFTRPKAADLYFWLFVLKNLMRSYFEKVFLQYLVLFCCKTWDCLLFNIHPFLQIASR